MVGTLSSEWRRDVDQDKTSRRNTYTEVFERLCPQYMAIGMTYHDFWNGDSAMAPMFRKAYLLKRETADYAAWRQGAYIYEAICDAAPILRAFSKARKPTPYRSEPFGFGEEESESSRAQKNHAALERGKSYMEALMISINKQFKAKGAGTDGRENAGA